MSIELQKRKQYILTQNCSKIGLDIRKNQTREPKIRKEDRQILVTNFIRQIDVQRFLLTLSTRTCYQIDKLSQLQLDFTLLRKRFSENFKKSSALLSYGHSVIHQSIFLSYFSTIAIDPLYQSISKD